MLTTALRLLAAWFGAACILLAFSEYVFFNEGPAVVLARSDDAAGSVRILVEMAVWYCLFASVFLVALRLGNVRSLAALLLCGALFGWATEGTVIAQVYEASPVSFAAPSLYWHMLLDVAFGWYLLRVVVRWRSWVAQVAFFAATGFVWGIWSTWPWSEGIVLTLGEYATYAGWVIGLMTVGLILTDWGGNAYRRVPAWLAWLAAIPCAVLGLFQGIAFVPWSVALLALVALTVLALVRHRRAEVSTDILARFDSPVAWPRYLAIVALPAVAIPVYGLMRENGTGMPPEDVNALLLLIGVAAYLWALWVCLGRKPAGGDG